MNKPIEQWKELSGQLIQWLSHGKPLTPKEEATLLRVLAYLNTAKDLWMRKEVERIGKCEEPEAD